MALHVYQTEGVAKYVRKNINDHIADNWTNVYKHKVALPYKETIGVGEHTEVIEINNDEEMVKFLRNDKSLQAYTNSHELLAVATIFNININIFTYNGNDGVWNKVSPDPEVKVGFESGGGNWVPDIFLYHNKYHHYDLLVKKDSRLFLGIMPESRVPVQWCPRGETESREEMSFL